MSDCSIVFVPLGIGTAAITPSRTANAKGRADALLLRGDMLLVALASALRTIAAADERARRVVLHHRHTHPRREESTKDGAGRGK